LRRSTLSWCRSTRILACNAVRDRNSPTTAHRINLQKSPSQRLINRFAVDRQPVWPLRRVEFNVLINMDSTVKALIVISLFAALCALVAVALGYGFFAAVFAAEFAYAFYEAVRRSKRSQ